MSLLISTLSHTILRYNIGPQLLSIIGFMMFFGIYLGYTFIPNSHFIQLMWILFSCYIVSLYSYIKLKKWDNG